ncbi:MAG: M12 family metallo-peptidase [Woeseiaceae bacterium]
MFSTKRLFIATLIAVLPSLSVAEVVVSHFEPLQRTQLSQTDKSQQSFGIDVSTSPSSSLRFEALGRVFDLQLQGNERVAMGIGYDRLDSSIQVYRGRLAGVSDSWARIVMFDGTPRGIVWDGREMFAIEAPNDSLVNTDTPVIYRLSDVHISPGTMACGADSLVGNAAAVVKELTASSKAVMARGPGAVSEITMSAIGDFEFTDAKGGDAGAVAAIVTRLNNVDGYFSEQVGVQITVQTPVETHSDPDDPFTDTTDSSELLDEVSEYRLQNTVHSSQGLTHLWTGRVLDGTTVGVAWRDALCETYFGSGLTEANASAFIDSLIATHEIGHNFGAEHDGAEGTPCEDDVGAFIMSASVNGSESFSQCSIDIMQARAAMASCVTALPTVDVGIKPTDPSETVFLGVETTREFEVSSNGLINAPGVAADFTLPALLDFGAVSTTLGTCTNGAGTVDCDLGELAGQSVQRISLTFTPNAVGGGTIFSNVSTTDPDERASNDQHQLQLVVEQPVDLVANVPMSVAVDINATTDVTATLQNNSDIDATDVSLAVSLQSGIRAESATWSAGTCVVAPQQIDCSTDVFPAQSSSDLTVTITGVSSGRRNVTLTLASTEADLNPANNLVVGAVVVNSQNNQGNDDDDGGGGALNLLMLLFAVSAVRIVGRRRK